MRVASKSYRPVGTPAGCQDFWEPWYLHDRADRQDQFLTIEQRFIGGFRRRLTQANLSLMSTLAMRLTNSFSLE